MSERDAYEQSLYSRNNEEPNEDDPQEPGYIYLNGMAIPCWGLARRDLSTFEGKLTIGPYTKDSDAVLSAWIQDNWGNGGLVDEHVEGATDQAFAWSSCWTLNSNQLSPTPYLNTISGTFSGINRTIPHTVLNGALIWTAGGRFYAVQNTAVCAATVDYCPPAYSSLYLGDDSFASFAEVPVACGVNYRGDLYIPTETSLLKYTSAFVLSEIAAHPAISVEVWDKRLYILNTDGEIEYLDPTGTWTAATEDRTIPSDERPIELGRFYDRVGKITLYVMTDKRMWVYDPTANVLLPAQEESWPRNISNSFRMWHDDAMYIGLGLGARRHSRDGIVSPVGLDRVEGLNAAVVSYRFPDDMPKYAIGDLTSSYNLLVGAIASVKSFALPASEPFSPPAGQATGRIVAYNESGWHQIAEIPNTINGSYKPKIVVEDPLSLGYMCFVGGQKYGDAYTGAVADTLAYLSFFNLPINQHGPLQNLLDSTAEFQQHGTLYTGWFDAGMAGFKKAAAWLEVFLTPLEFEGTDEATYAIDRYIEVAYRTEADESTWVDMGRTTTDGLNYFRFGVAADDFAEGLEWTKIEFRFKLKTDANAAYGWKRYPAIMQYFNFKFQKLPLPGAAWTAVVDYSFEINTEIGPKELSKWLTEQTYAAPFLRFLHQGETHRVKVTQHLTNEETGVEVDRTGTLSLIEIPDRGA